ncbi:hypothetical protein PM082_007591 [Marasmius tenuissimus]|nr:hypothetical protein PM082_007591 [Marasmius tenuissimus]
MRASDSEGAANLRYTSSLLDYAEEIVARPSFISSQSAYDVYNTLPWGDNTLERFRVTVLKQFNEPEYST